LECYTASVETVQEERDSTIQEKFDVSLLSKSDVSLWDKLVESSPHGTVFHYSWWLQDAGFDYQILVVRDSRGKLVGGIPLPHKSRAGLSLFHSPPLTPFLGPIFDIACLNKAYEKYSLMRHGGEAMARAIPAFDTLSYWAGSTAPDLQGFIWAGFDVRVAYTMRFESSTRAEDILVNMTTTHRNKLNKAVRYGIQCEELREVDTLLALHKLTFKRHRLQLPYSLEVPRRLVTNSLNRGHARIYAARAHGDVAAVLFVVNDSRNSYHLIAGVHPLLRSTGAGTLIEWYAIKDALSSGRAFDFEGSHLRGVEQHYRHWGAEARPIWGITKTGSVKGAFARLLNSWKMRLR
jgi:Acetyltransferase (GNAT) domain